MIKITDKDFYLPEILGQVGGRQMDTGTTLPMIIRGVCTKSGQKGDYVIKYVKAPRMSLESSCRELIAAFIAMELDLHVADPVLVNITQAFADSLRGNDGYKNAINSIGLNFGNKYYQGYSVFSRNPVLSAKEFEEAQKIYAFDVFISNPDRNNV